jgi:hypothetical protein
MKNRLLLVLTILNVFQHTEIVIKEKFCFLSEYMTCSVSCFRNQMDYQLTRALDVIHEVIKNPPEKVSKNKKSKDDLKIEE